MLADGDTRALPIALRTLADSIGMAELSKRTSLARESLYRCLMLALLNAVHFVSDHAFIKLRSLQESLQLELRRKMAATIASGITALITPKLLTDQSGRASQNLPVPPNNLTRVILTGIFTRVKLLTLA